MEKTNGGYFDEPVSSSNIESDNKSTEFVNSAKEMSAAHTLTQFHNSYVAETAAKNSVEKQTYALSVVNLSNVVLNTTTDVNDVNNVNKKPKEQSLDILSVRTENEPFIYKGARFSSFDDFNTKFQEWKEKYYFPLRVASSEKISNSGLDSDSNSHFEFDNKTFKYKYIVYHCAYYGKPRKRGNGKRPNQNYLPCGCTAMLRLNFNHLEQCLKITTLKAEHINHNVSFESFSRVSSKTRKVSPINQQNKEQSPNSTLSTSMTAKLQICSPNIVLNTSSNSITNNSLPTNFNHSKKMRYSSQGSSNQINQNQIIELEKRNNTQTKNQKHQSSSKPYEMSLNSEDRIDKIILSVANKMLTSKGPVSSLIDSASPGSSASSSHVSSELASNFSLNSQFNTFAKNNYALLQQQEQINHQNNSVPHSSSNNFIPYNNNLAVSNAINDYSSFLQQLQEKLIQIFFKSTFIIIMSGYQQIFDEDSLSSLINQLISQDLEPSQPVNPNTNSNDKPII